MSESSEKGVSLEDHIAKVLRKKLGARVERDKRSGAGSHRKMDISDYYQDTPFDIEAKNHKSIAVKEWMRQAKAGASLGRIPTVVFQADDDVLACLPFDMLVDIAAEVQQLRAEVEHFKKPAFAAKNTVEGVSSSDYKPSSLYCMNGHYIGPNGIKCLIKDCKYSLTFNTKRALKEAAKNKKP